jgi:hypothetical protein
MHQLSLSPQRKQQEMNEMKLTSLNNGQTNSAMKVHPIQTTKGLEGE